MSNLEVEKMCAGCFNQRPDGSCSVTGVNRQRQKHFAEKGFCVNTKIMDSDGNEFKATQLRTFATDKGKVAWAIFKGGPYRDWFES